LALGNNKTVKNWSDASFQSFYSEVHGSYKEKSLEGLKIMTRTKGIKKYVRNYIVRKRDRMIGIDEVKGCELLQNLTSY
jgi:hypothetical protein